MTPTSGGRSAGLAAPEVTQFLLDFADALHSVAVPIPDIERRVRHVGRALGVEVEAFLLQSIVALAGQAHAVRRIDFEYHWNLRRLAQLRALTDVLAAGDMTLSQGRAELDRIMVQPWRFARWQVVLGYAAYGAAVTARVGGAWREMAVGVVVGLLAGFIHLGAVINRPVDLLKSFIAALAGGLGVFALALALPPFDFARSLFGGVCLLVPAMLLTIGTYEIANDALESGLFRLAYGMLRFLFIALGLVVAVQIWEPIGGLDTRVAVPLPWPVVLALVTAGGVALTVCLQGRLRDLPWIVAGVLVAYGTHQLTKVVLGGDGSPLIAAFVLGAAGMLHGRLANQARGTMIIPGLLQLAPGFVGTEAVLQLLRGHEAHDDKTFFNVGLVTLQIVVGLMLAALVFDRHPRREPR